MKPDGSLTTGGEGKAASGSGFRSRRSSDLSASSAPSQGAQAEASPPARAATRATAARRPDEATATRQVAELLLGKGDQERDQEKRKPTESARVPQSRDTRAGAPESQEEAGDALPAWERPIQAEAAPDGSPEGSGGDKAKGKPRSLSEAAERLGLKPEEMYALAVTGAGDGEAGTLGEMKDAWQEKRGYLREVAQRHADLDQRESAIAADHQLWGQVGGELTAALTPETRAALKAGIERRDAMEREKLLREMPMLKDPERLDMFRTEITRILSEEGYRPDEMGIVDHRQFKVLRRLIRAETRLAEILKFRPEHVPPPGAVAPGKVDQKGRTKAAMLERARTGGDADKAAAIGALIATRGRR